MVERDVLLVLREWVASGILESRTNRGRSPDLFYLGDARGAEIDLLVRAGLSLRAVEVKSGSTIVGRNR